MTPPVFHRCPISPFYSLWQRASLIPTIYFSKYENEDLFYSGTIVGRLSEQPSARHPVNSHGNNSRTRRRRVRLLFISRVARKPTRNHVTPRRSVEPPRLVECLRPLLTRLAEKLRRVQLRGKREFTKRRCPRQTSETIPEKGYDNHTAVVYSSQQSLTSLLRTPQRYLGEILSIFLGESFACRRLRSEGGETAPR